MTYQHSLGIALCLAVGTVFAASTPAGAQSRTDPRVMPPVEKRDMPKSEGFDALDTSRDGYLQKDELSADVPRQRNFEKLDVDGDHRLSRDEWINDDSARHD